MAMVKNNRHHKSWLFSRTRDQSDDPFTTKPYTFSFEESGSMLSGKTATNQALTHFPSLPLEFGTAFEFSPESISTETKPSKRKKKKPPSSYDEVCVSDEDIPKHYQSIFTYESLILDGRVI